MNEIPNNPVASSPRPRRSLSPLFWLNLVVAAGLLGLLLASPFLEASTNSRMVSLFAGDSTVRKTALAGAIGLAVTAFVFFRRRGPDPATDSHRPPPSNVVGA
jgi:hypothetical protein